MNNNRNNNNNRRRGRGNRNQGGGGNQGNRIDSRARGNAPQLLEKYKKLAQDAQHNGDRVQAEYYLQFADHYFRVIADNKSRQDDQRGRRQEERDFDDEGGEDEDFDNRPRRDAQSNTNNRRQRNNRRDERDGDGREAAGRDDEPRDADDGATDTAYEPADNPFVRQSDDEGDARPRRGRKPRRTEGVRASEGEIDAAVLPPAFTPIVANEEDKPAAPRRRRRKLDDDDGPISAVG